MTFEEIQQELERLSDNYMQQQSDIITLKVEKEILEEEIEKLKNENDGLYEDIRVLNLNHDELKSEYEDSEYDRDSLYWQYWELKEKCDKVYDVANSFLINEADIEELLYFIKQLTA